MGDSRNRLPNNSLSDVRIRNDEPLTYAYFNAHMMKLLENIRAINISTTIQKATPSQWGVVRLATVDDLISEDGDKNAVVTNKVILDAISSLNIENKKNYRLTGKLPLSKNYEWSHGEFLVGLGENVAKKITDTPDNVVYSNVYFVPLGYEEKAFRMANSKPATEPEFFKDNFVSAGVINFDRTETPKNYEEFHVYYHRSGYVICRNGRVQDAQKQIKVVWNLLTRK